MLEEKWNWIDQLLREMTREITIPTIDYDINNSSSRGTRDDKFSSWVLVFLLSMAWVHF